MLFSRGDKNEGQTKKQSTLGFLFNPQIGESIRPLSMVYAMFAQIVAMVFVSADLFPKDHPGLRDPNIRLTMRGVIGTAYANLKWTREGIPQICLFAAVIAMFVFTAMFVLTLISSLFVTSAHAQSMFQSSGDYDWGNNWLSYLFLGKSMPTPDASIAPATSSCSMQQALGTALGFYSKGVLVLAGFMLMYFLFRMIADTALTGKFMGQANQIWGPIRLVVAIGLLVPVSSTSAGGCTVSGLNTAQYIVVQMAKVGSNLASSTWKTFASSLSSTSAGRSCSESDKNCAVIPVSVREMGAAVLRSYVCVAVAQSVIKEADLQETYKVPTPTTDLTPGKYPFSLKLEGQSEGLITYDGVISWEYCGGFNLKDVPKHLYGRITETYNRQLQSYLKRFEEYANKNVDKILKQEPFEEPNRIIEAFYAETNTAVQNELKTIDKQELDDTSFTEMGWVSAGAWFNSIARIQGLRSGSVLEGVPTPIALAVMASPPSKELKTVHQKVSDAMNLFAQKQGEHAYNDIDPAKTKAPDLFVKSAAKGTDALLRWMSTKTNPVEWFFGAIDYIGGVCGLWNPDTGQLALKFGATANPLAEIAAFGQNNLAVAGWLASLSAAAKVGAALVAGANDSLSGKLVGFFGTLGAANAAASGIAKTLDMIGWLMSLAALIFFNLGFVISYVLPMIPFFRFFFSSVSWLMSVFEAFVAAPLFALAHLSPYGDGLPGGARSGYFFILHIVLWPVLMIFGLIAGYLIFGVAVTFLNAMFIVASIGTGNFAGALPSLSKLVYTVMYCVFLYSLANQSFKTIGFFFQNAMSWLGGGGHQEKIGDPNALAIGGVAAYLSKDLMPLTTSAPAKLVKGRIDTVKDGKEYVKKKGNENLEDAKLRHEGWIKTENDAGVPQYSLQGKSVPAEVNAEGPEPGDGGSSPPAGGGNGGGEGPSHDAPSGGGPKDPKNPDTAPHSSGGAQYAAAQDRDKGGPTNADLQEVREVAGRADSTARDARDSVLNQGQGKPTNNA